jgi:hypothetical protein
MINNNFLIVIIKKAIIFIFFLKMFQDFFLFKKYVNEYAY